MKFLKNTKDIVLLDVPRGKKYISSQEAIAQEAQKGFTCWYYAFNILRGETRIGKLESLSFPNNETRDEQDQNPLILNLIKLRKLEESISSYRKSITKIDKIGEVVNDTSQTQFPEEDSKNIIKTCQSTLIKLGYKNPEEEVIKWMNEVSKKLESGSQFDSQQFLSRNLQGRVNMYWRFVHFKVAEKYGLEFSKWHPADGFDNFMEILRKEGVLSVYAQAGKSYYKNAPSVGQMVNSYFFKMEYRNAG